MVATARLRRAKERVVAARPYAREIQGMIKRVAGSSTKISHPLLLPRERKSVGYVVFTSDRGLCGAFNSHVINRAEIGLAQEENAGVVVIGRKGRDYFRRTKYNLVAEFLAIGDEPALAQALGIARTLVELYKGHTFDEINLVFTEFISMGRQRPAVMKLFPIEASADAEEPDGDAINGDYIIEQNLQDVLEMLLPRFIEAEVYRALLEAKASEHASRMMSMTQATDNAREMIEQLTLLSNKARQAAITSEISEIVGGAEALKG